MQHTDSADRRRARRLGAHGAPTRDAARRRLARVAWLLDSSIPLPGMKFRIGLDAILGLLPGIGDVLGVVLSSYVVREAARLGAPPALLARMAFNVAVEGVVGLVPFLGDVFDAAWKANQRNVTLLEAHLDDPHRTARASRWFVTLLTIGLIAFIVLIAVAGFLLVRALVSAFQG
jgi:branched-subunit amino acid ABC-type transport system permease component